MDLEQDGARGDAIDLELDFFVIEVLQDCERLGKLVTGDAEIRDSAYGVVLDDAAAS